MTTYEVWLVKSAQKELNKLPNQINLRIITAIYKLSADPRKGKVRPMVGTKSWRLRIGYYRVVYDIFDSKLIILIIRIRHHKEAYRND